MYINTSGQAVAHESKIIQPWELLQYPPTTPHGHVKDGFAECQVLVDQLAAGDDPAELRAVADGLGFDGPHDAGAMLRFVAAELTGIPRTLPRPQCWIRTREDDPTDDRELWAFVDPDDAGPDFESVDDAIDRAAYLGQQGPERWRELSAAFPPFRHNAGAQRMHLVALQLAKFCGVPPRATPRGWDTRTDRVEILGRAAVAHLHACRGEAMTSTLDEHTHAMEVVELLRANRWDVKMLPLDDREWLHSVAVDYVADLVDDDAREWSDEQIRERLAASSLPIWGDRLELLMRLVEA